MRIASIQRGDKQRGGKGGDGVMGVMWVRNEGRVPPSSYLPLGGCFHIVTVTFKFVLHILVLISQTCACTRECWPTCLSALLAHVRARGDAPGGG